ncbi:MAG: hypothetical protein ACRC9P_07745 [Bacteroides sp.]
MSQLLRQMIQERLSDRSAETAVDPVTNSRLLEMVTGVGNDIRYAQNEAFKSIIDRLDELVKMDEKMHERLEKMEQKVDTSNRSLRKVAQAIIVTNPKGEKELKKIFTNSSLWEEINNG